MTQNWLEDELSGRLAIQFMQQARREYVREGKPTGEANSFRHALRLLTAAYRDLRVVDFGRKKLKSFQSMLVQQDYSQTLVNGRIRRIKQGVGQTNSCRPPLLSVSSGPPVSQMFSEKQGSRNPRRSNPPLHVESLDAIIYRV